MIKLSKRLSHLADMVSEGAVLADVGTDHGYIPISLLLTGKIVRAFAMDVREGPLQRAKNHTAAYGLGDYITFRLSDGVLGLSEGEADCILIAGMGGNVMLHILQEGESVIRSAKELVLQPQSDISMVRSYLYKQGYWIDREDMVFEEGKYYPMMHISMECKPMERQAQSAYTEEEWQIIYRYGEYLLNHCHKTLKEYLLQRIGTYQKILAGIADKSGEAVRLRKEEVMVELALAEHALNWNALQAVE